MIFDRRKSNRGGKFRKRENNLPIVIIDRNFDS